MIIMKRTLVIGDIHGGLRALKQILERASVTTKDTLIFLGDYVDGWSESPELLDFLIDLGKKQNCIFIRGNHDELALHWLQNKHDNPTWATHGGDSTMLAYETVSEKDKKRHIEFLLGLENYYIDTKNRLFVHAGFNRHELIEEQHFKNIYWWDRDLIASARSYESMTPEAKKYKFKMVGCKQGKFKNIFIGHTPVQMFNESTPQKYANIYNLDCGAGKYGNGTVCIMNVETKEYKQF